MKQRRRIRSAAQRIREVVERWFLLEPLLFAVWTAHELVIDPRILSIRVRRGRVEYNPRFIDALDRRRLEDVLAFEAMRILLKHPYTRRKENAEKSYAASNLTLQEYLQTALPFPRARELFGHGEFDLQYFEFYYRQLCDLPPSAAAASDPAGDSTQILGLYADPATSGRQNTQDWDADELIGGEIDDKIRAAGECDSWGTLAGRHKASILALLEPRMNYRAVLRHFRASILSIHRRLTRMKPNRRYGFLYMGSRYDFTTRLLFAVDVSGSMSDTELARGFSVVNRFFRYGIPQIDVIQFDTEIKGEPLPLKRALRRFEVLGRGGTSFQPVIDYIDLHPGYDGLIIFTDGLAPVPRRPRPRGTRVLWLFNRKATYQRMNDGLRTIGLATHMEGS